MLSILIVICCRVVVTAARLSMSSADFSKMAEKLWDADENAASNEIDLKLHYASRTSLSAQTDKASGRLFNYVDQVVLQLPTFRALEALYPYFDPDTSKQEVQTTDKTRTIDLFLDAIADTNIIKDLREFFKKRGLEQAETMNTFKKYLRDIWFFEYSRGQRRSSSAFEHVFLYDMDDSVVKGLHNWVRMYRLERDGRVDYAGFSKTSANVAKLIFRLDGQWKMSSLFMGSSPEMEIALHTLCFAMRQTSNNVCRMVMPDCTQVTLTSHPQRLRDRTVIGTSFPDPGSKAVSCAPRQITHPHFKENEEVIRGTSSSGERVASVLGVLIGALLARTLM